MEFMAVLKSIDELRRLSQRQTEEAKAKLSPDVRKRINQLEEEHCSKAQELEKKVQEEIRSMHGSAGMEHFTNLLRFFKLDNDAATTQALSLEEKLLPLCQLAYLYEKNGIPEDHAKN